MMADDEYQTALVKLLNDARDGKLINRKASIVLPSTIICGDHDSAVIGRFERIRHALEQPQEEIAFTPMYPGAKAMTWGDVVDWCDKDLRALVNAFWPWLSGKQMDPRPSVMGHSNPAPKVNR